MVIIDKEAINEAYEDVRNDSSSTTWVLLEYDEKDIKLSKKGEDYGEFLDELADDNRYYCYVRMMTGDEMSKRAKFALISWCGAGVSPMKKAKMSTDKGFVKSVINSFSVEILADEKSDVSEDTVRTLLVKAGGANYGTGSRS